ncbi:MAG TPA: hypothetical protein PKD83_11585, partial [Ignavibacteria bacterium]|nr:hypothetical protein [Ignavibacteria bacterium]
MKKLSTSSVSTDPIKCFINCSILSALSFAIILSCVFSVNLSAQTVSYDDVKKLPEKRRLQNNIPVQRSALPPETDAITRNVPADFATIQAAINASNNGDIIQIAAGTYREDITLNKYLIIRGANYGINPNTGSRVAETIIQPAFSDPDPYSPTYEKNFYIGSNGSSSKIDGITFDGDNPTLNSGVVINGADIDAAVSIAAYDGLSNVTLSNNIFKNINYAALDLDNYFSGGASTYDNSVIYNKFDNINVTADFGIGVVIYDNCYTNITDNVFTRTRIGIQTGNFYNADIGSNHSISNNQIDSYRLGIFHNLAYSNATAYIITNNVITTMTGALRNLGIEIASIQSSVGVTLTDNNITGAKNGYNLWNCPTSNTVTITGGLVTNCMVGVFANNYDGYNSDAASSVYAMTGVTMTNCDTAIWIRDNNLNSVNATIALNINNTTNIVNGTGIGLLIEGGDASVSFSAGDPIDFNTTLSKYIRLITNGSNVPSANINAQEVKFGGTKGSSSTNSQLFAIEDKVDHKTDWNSLGFVQVKAFNNYVTTSSFYPPNTTSASIQNGIDIATAGDTVNAGTGTFNESINLNKSVTLAGSGPSMTVISPAIIVCPTAINGITITSSNVNLINLTVSNYNYGIVTSSSTVNIYNVESINNCNYGLNTANGTNGLNITKCKLNNNLVGGWRTGTLDNVSNVMMDSCEVKGHSTAPNGFGTFIAASTTSGSSFNNITIKNSDFSNNLRKGMYFEKLNNALIDNVTIDNSGTDATYGFNNGIDINLKNGVYTNITLQNSSVTNCGSTGTAGDVNNPSAIAVKARDDGAYSANPATLTGFTMKNCFVTGPVNGLRFGEFNVTNNSPTGNTVIENNFGGAYSNKAIVNKTANTITVSCNWYGSAAPAAVIALHGSGLNYIPFLTDGTDNDLINPGFQIVPGSCNGTGPVKNITQTTSYPTIQLAVNAANNGDIIEVDPGVYNEQVLINKEVTIKNSGAKPVINYSGTPSLVSGKLTIFEITVPNVTIESLVFEVDLAKLGSAIIASALNMNNLTIKNNDINPYKTGTLISFGSRNAVNINYAAYRINSSNPSNILAENNTISYNFYGTPLDPSDDAGFRSGFATDEGGGTFNLNTIQTISQDIEARFGGAGDINITNNNINGGGVILAEYNAGAGNINVTGNTFDGTFGNTYSSSLRLKNNQQIKTTVVSGNIFQNHNWGMSIENYRAVTIDNNSFTPVAASTVFRHITVNTKLLASSSATVAQTAIDATFTNNTFNGSGTPGGTGIAFYNHDSDNDTYGTFTMGSSGNENKFNPGIAAFLSMDPSTGPSWPSAFPENNLGAPAITTMACWSTDINVENNKFD